MIRVERTGKRPPDLYDRGSAGEKERKAARSFFGSKKSGTFAGFTAYKSPSVRERLFELFHGKCAYCEWQIAPGAKPEIEHYRPKGGVYHADALLERYWWLASEWDNLLAACRECNTLNKHSADGKPQPRYGKANFFPLHGDARPARRPVDVAREKPLLLNPCEDEPSRHLEFRADGTVVPTMKGKKEDPRGRSSINVYGLFRKDLANARRACALRLTAHLEVLARTNEAHTRRVLWNEVAAAIAPTATFAGMARQLVAAFLAANRRAKPPANVRALLGTRPARSSRRANGK